MKTIVIFEFMMKDLKLKGSELLVYALIYGFSQFKQNCFMKPESMAKFLGLSRSQVFRALSSLNIKNFIIACDDGYSTNNPDHCNNEYLNKLEEVIRIAKTPWLD